MLKKGQTKRIWTKEQKLAIIKRYYEEHISAGSLAKEYDADKSNERLSYKLNYKTPVQYRIEQGFA